MSTFTDKVKVSRQGERMIPLSEIKQACKLTPLEAYHLDTLLKDHAAQYWLQHGDDPARLRSPGGELQLVRSLTGSTGASEPAYSQTLFNHVISLGMLTPKDGILESPFFKLPKEEQKAIVDGLASGKPLPLQDVMTGQVERLAIRAGLKDEVFRD